MHFIYLLEIPSHDLAFSRLSQQDSTNEEPSCNHELSQNGKPSDTQINSETNITGNYCLFYLFVHCLNFFCV